MSPVSDTTTKRVASEIIHNGFEREITNQAKHAPCKIVFNKKKISDMPMPGPSNNRNSTMYEQPDTTVKAM